MFMALGDMPYTVPDDVLRFKRLIARINDLRPAFSLHVGDFKSGSTSCGDESFQRVFDLFARFERPLIYTPGDNDWTDCHRANNGSYDPLERLAKVRSMFFADPHSSLGKQRLTLTSQTVEPQFSKYVENVRWERAGVIFSTIHVVGSNNNLQRDQTAVNEYIERNAANLAWIETTFRHARAIDARAIVFAFHAQPRFDREPPDADQRSGFNDTINSLKLHAMAFGRPLLIIHGDYHTLVIDRPLMGPNHVRILNATRIMVPGGKEVHGIMVGVDTGDPDIFTFKPVMIPENMPVWRER